MKSLFKNLKAINPQKLSFSSIFMTLLTTLPATTPVFLFPIQKTLAQTVTCQSPYNEVYAVTQPAGTTGDFYAIHAPTGAATKFTSAPSSFGVTAINTAATDHVNKIVYYGDANKIYAWDAINNQHITVTANFQSLLTTAGYTGKFVTLSSGGAGFYGGALYVGVDGNINLGIAVHNFDQDFEIFRVNLSADGKTAVSVTPLGIKAKSGGTFTTNTMDDWGDFIISDTGVILALSTNRVTRNSTTYQRRFWKFDLNSNTYSFVNNTTENAQLAKSGDGRLWGLRSASVVLFNDNGGVIGSPVPTTVQAFDGAECVVGNASVGDRVWSDTNGDGIQDAGEAGITGVTVAIYRDIDKDGVIDTGEPKLATQVTDANGNYDFTGLLPHDRLTGAGHNDFIVKVESGVPASYTATTPTQKNADLASATEDINTADFGYKPPTHNISGSLYEDTDGGNDLDATEPKLPANITVNLLDNSNNIIKTTTTDANGAYTFIGVANGNYKIQVDTSDADISAGLTLGTPNDLAVTVSGSPVTNQNFGFDIQTGFCDVGGGTADTAINPYISAEVTNNVSATRVTTDTLDDDWRTATGGLANGAVEPWFGTANALGNLSNFTYLDPTTSATTNTTVELVQIPIAGSANCAGLSNTTSSNPFLATSATLQSTSPRPNSLYNTSNQPAFWNQTVFSTTDNRRFATRFTFDQPVKSFGAWFGDLETRTQNGTPAILRLLDESGNRIGKDIPIEPTNIYDGTPPEPQVIDQSQCGTSASDVGCGNSATRWVGFVDSNSTPRIKQVLVIVGDDDLNDNGDTEIMSFIGANILPPVASNPNVLLVKRITAVNATNYTEIIDGVNDANSSNYVPSPFDAHDNNPNWAANYLQGRLNGGNVRPGDEIEYSIYYLSTGDTTANNVMICDRVPENATFIPTAFNNFPTKNIDGLPGADRGIIWQNNGATESLTNSNDGDTAEYLSPGIDPTIQYPGIKCDGSNTNGVVVVKLGNLPNAIAPGTPINSHGFIRFRGRVK
ncbi:MAG: hypothetical protein HC785_25290 [Calothrix sp. CSU_2_0]|nr:hypothetical protein [Calothrix sp. CSU_2_0]